MDQQTSPASRTPVTPEILVPRLGESLVNRGLLSEARLKQALDLQKERASTGQTILLGQAIIELGFLNRETLDRAVTEQIILLRQALEDANRNLERRVQERTAELQEALRKLAEMNRLKSNFIANVSHELRTPLTHVKGYIELLFTESLGPINEDQRNALDVSQRATSRLQGLIDDLILFSLASRGEMTLRLDAVDIQKIASDLTTRANPKAEDKQITLSTNFEADLPLVMADEQKISWVLTQLLDNAIKFTPAGGKVVFEARKDVSPKMIRVSVSDTGIGIPEEQQTEIFEPFHQLDGSSTRHYGGTGLGLSLVKQIIEAHGSIIRVKSEAGKGSTFSFPLLGATSGKGGA
jgi:two-component system sensor histidine kinase BarA